MRLCLGSSLLLPRKPMNIKQILIKAGVKNLREFGYEFCNADNIMTDEVYSQFFLSMLNDNRGLGVDREIDELVQEIKQSANQ